MKGLTLFISDIRKCQSKEEETKRINKELANIRKKFGGIKPLSGYQKKKYVCKLVYMFLLGYKNVEDIGYIEAINLLSSNAYSEKQIGYLFLSVLFKNDHDSMFLVKNALQNDITSSNPIFQNMALQFIANHPTKDMAELAGEHVFRLLTSFEEAIFVKQTAVLTLLRLIRFRQDLIRVEQHADLICDLLSHYNLGLATASASLIDYLSSLYPNDYKSCVKPAITRLERTVKAPVEDFADYSYYNMALPWFVIKLLRILQKYPIPSDMSLEVRLFEALEKIIDKYDDRLKTKRVEERNIKYAVIFEGIRTVVKNEISMPLVSKSLQILTSTLQHKDSNLRQIALDIMAEFSKMSNWRTRIKFYWGTILNALAIESDITVKKSVVDLLYNICDETNVKNIVEEMMILVEEGEQTDMEDVVLKIANLAEKLSIDSKWYVNTVFKLLQKTTGSISDSIWFTLIKAMTDNHTIREQAVRSAYDFLEIEPVNDNVVKASGYILGEFGDLIATDPRTGYLQQLELLRARYTLSAAPTRSLLLTTYMKFLKRYPDLKEYIQSLLLDKINICSKDIEVQQRAVEYLKMSQSKAPDMLSTVFQEMPPWKRKDSAVVKALQKRKWDPHSTCTQAPEAIIIPEEDSVSNLSNPSSTDLLSSTLQHFRTNTVSYVDLLVDIFGETYSFQ